MTYKRVLQELGIKIPEVIPNLTIMDKDLIKKILVENQEFIRDIEIFPRNISFEDHGNDVLI